MSLDIYEYDASNNSYVLISQDGLQTRPVQTTHNGTTGEVVEKQLFLRNSNELFYYTNIALKSTPASRVKIDDPNHPEAYISYKIITKDIKPSGEAWKINPPTKTEWAAAISGDAVPCLDIGTTNEADTSYKSFWIQVSIPSGTRIGALKDISIELTAEANPLGA